MHITTANKIIKLQTTSRDAHLTEPLETNLAHNAKAFSNERLFTHNMNKLLHAKTLKFHSTIRSALSKAQRHILVQLRTNKSTFF